MTLTMKVIESLFMILNQRSQKC